MTEAPAGDDRPNNMWEELNRPKERDVAAAPTGADHDDHDDRAGVPLTGIIGGAVAIAAVAFAGFIVMGGGEAEPAATEAVEETDQLALAVDDLLADADADADDEAAADDGAGDEAAADDGSAEDASGDESEAAPDVADPAADLPTDTYSPAIPAGAEGNYSVLSRGRLYLRGEIPSPLIAVGAVNALEDVLGEGNVIAEYVINPEAPFEMGAASDVYIEDTVLFRSGSAEIAPDFYPLLGLGVVLMGLQDGVTIEVYGHTDSTGSDEANLALSQERVDAVKAFWVSQGVDPSRISAVGLGESDPVADNSTPEGRQANRRVELIVEGFVFSL